MNRDIKNPNAFPYSGVGDDTNYSKGMTLRDYFAAHAMQGMFASGNLRRSIENDEVAEVAYRMADAMMKARKA